MYNKLNIKYELGIINLKFIYTNDKKDERNLQRKRIIKVFIRKNSVLNTNC